MAGRLRSIAKILIIDVTAPLIACSLLRSAGMSTVTVLVLSGVFPHWAWPSAPSSTAAGAVVLAGILAGTVLSLIGHSAPAGPDGYRCLRPCPAWPARARCGCGAR